MRLLITTQSVDQDDPILGFFHGWLEAFSKKFEHIEVVCLREGKHALPSNVGVHTLGKEKGNASSVVYAFRFLSHIWKLRRSYDAVLVHMNPEYIVLAGLLWRVLGKKIHLWYNHPKGGVRLFVASLLADKVFYTSPYAATAKLKKAVRMPAGIDTTLFTPQKVKRMPHSVYLQGRVTPSKRVEMACEAVRLLRAQGTPVTLTVVGPEDKGYADGLRKEYKELLEAGALSFLGSKPNRETPALYSAHEVSLNLAADGHYDKTVLESLACGTPVIVVSSAFSDAPVLKATFSTAQAIADVYPRIQKVSSEEDLVRYVHNNHDLRVLADRLSAVITY